MSSRHDQIAAFYLEKATALQRSVRRSVTGPDAMIEDACSYAWCQLLRHPSIQLDVAGFSWLYIVAKREAFRLSDRARREPALGEPHELPPTPRQLVSDVSETTERLAEMRERAELLCEISERKRDLVLLHALGYTYTEIAELTGDSPRTIERQLLRGKRAIRRLDQARRRVQA